MKPLTLLSVIIILWVFSHLHLPTSMSDRWLCPTLTVHACLKLSQECISILKNKTGHLSNTFLVMKSGQLYQTPWRDVLTSHYKKRQPGSSCYSHEVRQIISKCFNSFLKEASSTPELSRGDSSHNWWPWVPLWKESPSFLLLLICLNDFYRTGSFECVLFCFVFLLFLFGWFYLDSYLLVVVLIVLSFSFWIDSFVVLAGGAHTDSFTGADSSVSFSSSSSSFISFYGTLLPLRGADPFPDILLISSFWLCFLITGARSHQ